MKKVLIAMDNIALLEKIKKCGKYDVHTYDMSTKEDVLEYLEKYRVDVLITKDSLFGNMSKEEYINGIRNFGEKTKVILCVDKLDEIYKGFLFSKNIFDIIEGNEAGFEDIFNMIDSKDKMIILKNNSRIAKQSISKNNTLNILTKQKICVFGTSGAGKSYVASILAQITSRKLKLNTLLVDLDVQNAAIDIYNNLNSSGNNLQFVMEEIDRGSFNAQMLNELVSKEKKRNGKLSFITNNMGIYECQNKLSEEYYSKLYSETENEYDVLILDMPSAPFLDVVPYSLTKADKVFFVVNPNFISMRQAVKYLDLITNIWKIAKEKVYIVINKAKKDSLSLKQIAAILDGYNICLEVAEDTRLEGIINGLGELNVASVDEVDKVAQILGLMSKENTENEAVLSKIGVSYDN